MFLCFVASAGTPKYVFYFIGDGMGINQVALANLYNEAAGLEPVNFSAFPVKALVSSRSANSLVTDSSAAGTALGGGEKINNGGMGIRPDGVLTHPLTEYAKAKGYGCGVVTSVGINHATPSAFYAHTPSRNDLDVISRQLIDSKDVDFAAGSTFLHGRGSQMQPDNWIAQARDAGITVMCGKQEFRTVKGSRVICLGGDYNNQSALPYAIDRSEGDTKLADFTAAAIDYLSANFSKGFFLMVEGGKIDYACHGNDAATTVYEINDMCESVALALDFYSKHPDNTLIVVTADHETGGMSIGCGKYECNPGLLAGQKLSKDELSAALSALQAEKGDALTWGDVKALLRDKLGFWDTVPVDPRAEKRFTQIFKDSYIDGVNDPEVNLYSVNSRMAAAAIEHLDKTAQVGWVSGSHSGATLPVYVIGAKASEFAAISDNTDIPLTIRKVAKY